MNNKIIIAGGSGFLGQALAPALIERGYEVTVLGRGAAATRGGVQHLQWDGRTLEGWAAAVDGAKAVVNLTGKSVNVRHTAENKREIIGSRIDSVRVLGAAIARCANPPQAFVQASGIGFYGDTGDLTVDETAPVGSDFMADVCQQWEGALDALPIPATRKVVLRIGVVLGRNGGALQLLEKLTRLFAGGAVGSGRQFVSWIHIADAVRIFVAAIEQPEILGTFNATAPEPVTNAELMRELRRTLHRPWSPPVPAPFARLGAWLMGSEGDLALLSYRCAPRRIAEHGFTFDFPTLNTALGDLYGMDKPA
jgi:uncharacterized protein (TIGR01777 family)